MSKVTSELLEDQSVLRIKIDGVFTFELNRAFSDIYHSAPVSVKKYVIDFSGVEYVDSSALGILLVMKKSGEEHGVESFCLENCRQNILDVMNVCHFGDIFSMTTWKG